MYKIILSDGTEISDLELNGNNYISKAPVEESIFIDNLSHVVITDGETTEEYDDMKLMSLLQFGENYHIVLGEKTAQEKLIDSLQAMGTNNADSITDVQVALAEVYELILGGMA